MDIQTILIILALALLCAPVSLKFVKKTERGYENVLFDPNILSNIARFGAFMMLVWTALSGLILVALLVGVAFGIVPFEKWLVGLTIPIIFLTGAAFFQHLAKQVSKQTMEPIQMGREQ